MVSDQWPCVPVSGTKSTTAWRFNQEFDLHKFVIHRSTARRSLRRHSFGLSSLANSVVTWLRNEQPGPKEDLAHSPPRHVQ
ncbi:hypothetical protein VTK26DRAFT_515 [Humicola hyalothermophila]